MNKYRVYKNGEYVYTTLCPTKKKVLEIINDGQPIKVASVPKDVFVTFDLENDKIKVEKVND